MVPGRGFGGCSGGCYGGCYGGWDEGWGGDVLLLGQTGAGAPDHRRRGGGSTAAPKVASINNTEKERNSC